jgi:hypothetical protein
VGRQPEKVPQLQIGQAPGEQTEESRMSEQRQVIEFLRRRYASAILRDDAETAGRMRAQLDGLMNHAGSSRAERDNDQTTQMSFLPAAGASARAAARAGQTPDLGSGDTARR